MRSILLSGPALALAAATGASAGAETRQSGVPSFLSGGRPQQQHQHSSSSKAKDEFMRKLMSSAQRQQRRLDDGGGDDDDAVQGQENYIDDVSPYTAQFGKCLRVKIQAEDNDDGQEGNQYFYNGRYHAQYHRYASFYLCDNSDGNNGQCSSCDEKEYVVDLETYVGANVEYRNNYCAACLNVCGADDDAGNYAYSCDDCDAHCENFDLDNANNNGDDGGNGGGNYENALDETRFLYCQEAYMDEYDEVQYYAGPMCSKNGDIYIGVFYDDECTVSAGGAELEHYQDGDGNYVYPEYNYNSFRAIEDMCFNCNSDENAAGICTGFYQESYHCDSGTNVNYNYAENDNENVCKNYFEAGRIREYSNGRKKKGLPTWAKIAIACGTLFIVFAVASYMYFVRHKSSTKTPLSQQEAATDGVVA